jgi:hypothetical protein
VRAAWVLPLLLRYELFLSADIWKALRRRHDGPRAAGLGACDNAAAHGTARAPLRAGNVGYSQT